jgi:S-adenosylmethionine/arginine decarboxylase-like enzyme
MTNSYGKELILSLEDCNAERFTRGVFDKFFTELCELIHVEKGDRYFWDDVGVPLEEQQTDPRLKGTSAVQFILTSNITIHALDLMERLFLNVFSCDDFDPNAVRDLTRQFFGGSVRQLIVVERD